jgi:hypothetical protein
VGGSLLHSDAGMITLAANKGADQLSASPFSAESRGVGAGRLLARPRLSWANDFECRSLGCEGPDGLPGSAQW